MQLADFLIAGKEEEIVNAQILGSFLHPGNKRIRKLEPVKIVSSEATHLFMFTVKHYLVLSLEQLQRLTREFSSSSESTEFLVWFPGIQSQKHPPNPH